MRGYFVKTPFWLRMFFPGYRWSMPASKKTLYLTFDDGPHPAITPFVLDELKKYDARASFFCVGENVQRYPGIYRSILAAGHTAGNHTQHHVNGWKTSLGDYLEDVRAAGDHIESRLFRPPYGRIRRRQAAALKKAGYEILMWDVLSGDFDESLSPEKCLGNVLRSARSGSIIVFHDSDKAQARLLRALPGTLDHFAARGYRFESLPGLQS